ncbi:hypothetical protein C2845_PM13G19620 [Panicum miliaceum]|uniref:Uncharacterized protein n=1 Tax=Panicum miliaceum TaxID=4540 RepID=A0A3L6RFW5_PANMI|nr:hypothetical protein C2845_PM13G19620 [Panicum miliaceum]
MQAGLQSVQWHVINTCGSICGAGLDNLDHECQQEQPKRQSRRCQRCAGLGCCQVPVPIGRASYSVRLKSLISQGGASLSSSVFISEEGWFQQPYNYSNRPSSGIPAVLAWAIVSGGPHSPPSHPPPYPSPPSSADPPPAPPWVSAPLRLRCREPPPPPPSPSPVLPATPPQLLASIAEAAGGENRTSDLPEGEELLALVFGLLGSGDRKRCSLEQVQHNIFLSRCALREHIKNIEKKCATALQEPPEALRLQES